MQQWPEINPTYKLAKSAGIPKKEQYQITTVVKKIGSWYYLGTTRGLYISSDGLNWSADQSIPNDANIAFPVTKINSIYYLGTSQGLYTSENGTTWNKDHALGLPYSPGFHNPLQKVGNIDYILIYEGLYMSLDGTNWSATNVFKSTTTSTKVTTNVRKYNNIYYVGTSDGLYTSINEKDWTQNASTKEINITELPKKINNTYYLRTFGQGLWTSINGQSFVQNKSIPTDAPNWNIKCNSF